MNNIYEYYLMSLRPKTLKPRIIHQLDNIDNMFTKPPNRQKSLNTQLLIQSISFILLAKHNLHHFLCQLKVSIFKPHIICRRYIKNKAKINMDDMSQMIQQYIAIMSILDLEYITNNRVSSLAPNKSILSPLIPKCSPLAIPTHIIL